MSLDTSPPTFDLLAESFVADPYPILDRMRTDTPVYWSEALGGWVLTRYDDVVATFRNVADLSNEGRLGRAAAYLDAETRRRLSAFEDHYKTKGLLHSDPPDHTRLRRLVLRSFSPRIIETMRPRIQQIVDGLLDRVANQGEMDVIEDLASALPVTILAELLGVPIEDGRLFRTWADRLLAFQGLNRPAESLLLGAQSALLEARAYLADLIEARRRAPGTDLISTMTRVGPDGEALTDDEIINTGVTLLTAGHETTTSLIGNGLHALLSHPDQWTQLRADRTLITSATEEMLRYESPVARQPRLVTRDMSLGGHVLSRGQMVFQMLGAANRDPLHFTDPGHFDIRRQPNRHIAFGHGIHFCIGAPLSRAEGEIVFESLLSRLPGLRLADPEPHWDTAKANSRVLRSLLVRF